MPASNGFTRLVNYFVIVWAFLEMWNAKGFRKIRWPLTTSRTTLRFSARSLVFVFDMLYSFC
ncbi:hypothetical protein BDP27DRAFT_1430683 [Rhodocollybia butyracea]|uniref:Uncharacterized protein n=1 Tax=Rhodocollybia butyracea TaxID=206335 RepID=A0A9P5TZ59_9AGAR|nr:hypothetical protein BDP27DRAFT_1430683 [Rhodocollybia butyracea]